MPFKALRLKRTNVFYPSSGSIPNLGALLNTLPLTQDAIDDILDIEDSAFAESKQGASNDDLEKLVSAAKKASLLSASLLRKIYFHILRKSALPKKCNQGDLETLFFAYQDLMAELHRGYPSVHFPKLSGLLVFGYSGQLNLDKALLPNHDEFQHRISILNQCNKYSHLPGMLDKIDKFRRFSDDDKAAKRLLALLRVLNYQPSDFNSPHSIAYFSIDLKFWGMVAIVLLNKNLGQDVLGDFFAMKATLPHFDEHAKILARFVDASGESELSVSLLKFQAVRS